MESTHTGNVCVGCCWNMCSNWPWAPAEEWASRVVCWLPGSFGGPASRGPRQLLQPPMAPATGRAPSRPSPPTSPVSCSESSRLTSGLSLVLICLSPVTNGIQHDLLSARVYIFFQEMLIQNLFPMLNWAICFLLPSLIHSGYKSPVRYLIC